MSDSLNRKPLYDVILQFLKLGFTSFGGPIAHIGYFRQSLIAERRWMKDDEYAQLVAICQFLPGPASSQVGFALGLKRAGWLGGLFAFLCFTLPSALFLIFFAHALPGLPDYVQTGLIKALKLVAAIVVFQAIAGMWKGICVDIRTKVIAIVSCTVLLFAQFSSVHLIVLLAAAIAGISVLNAQQQSSSPLQIPVSKSIGVVCLCVFSVLLLMSIAFVSALPEPSLPNIFAGFYETGALIFGGGHVVLPMLQQTVVASGWATEQSFIIGYGAAQAVPGPLFTLATFLGYEIDSTHWPFLVAMVATIAIFLPGFLLLVGVLPFWQMMIQYPIIANAISGLNAGVVGLLAATFVNPIVLSSANSLLDIGFMIIACVGAVFFKLSIFKVIALCFVYSSLYLIALNYL